MRHLPSPRAAFTMQVNPEANSTAGPRVLAVGRIRKSCTNCGDFPRVMVRIDGKLLPVDCAACSKNDAPVNTSTVRRSQS